MPAVGRRDSASAFSAAALRCVALLLACCAGKRFAFPRLRTLAGSRIPPLAHKKAPWAVMGSGRSIVMAGTEGFEPPTAGTKNRSSTVELRPNVWCCPKATRLVYLICEGIANAVEQAYGECLRVAGREGAVVARHARELNANASRLLLRGDIGGADALG